MITCASKTFSTAEHRYSQIEKEALGIVFGFKRFQQFLMGRQVELYTDHKPLTFIFNPETEISTTALQRIQRWSMFLANCSYTYTRWSRQDELPSRRALAFTASSGRRV